MSQKLRYWPEIIRIWPYGGLKIPKEIFTHPVQPNLSLSWPNITLVTHLWQILINDPKFKILTWNFQDMFIWVNWDLLGDLTSPGPT